MLSRQRSRNRTSAFRQPGCCILAGLLIASSRACIGMEVVLMVHPYLEFRDAPGETEACLIFFLCCFVCVCVCVWVGVLVF